VAQHAAEAQAGVPLDAEAQAVVAALRGAEVEAAVLPDAAPAEAEALPDAEPAEAEALPDAEPVELAARPWPAAEPPLAARPFRAPWIPLRAAARPRSARFAHVLWGLQIATQ